MSGVGTCADNALVEGCTACSNESVSTDDIIEHEQKLELTSSITSRASTIRESAVDSSEKRMTNG